MSEILKQYRAMAAGGKAFRGLSILKHADDIGDVIRQTGSRTLLDFGCGAAEAYDKPHSLHERWGVPRPTLYDPAFEKFRAKPAPGLRFDGVICSDVLEHVRRDDVPKFIAGLFERADRFVFASVCCRPAAKTFPDGTNLHITIEPPAWWFARFAEQAIERATRHAPVRWVLKETP